MNLSIRAWRARLNCVSLNVSRDASAFGDGVYLKKLPANWLVAGKKIGEVLLPFFESMPFFGRCTHSGRKFRRAPTYSAISRPAYMAVGKFQEDVWKPVRYYLFEGVAIQKFNGLQWEWQWQWNRHGDYTDPVKLPPWLADPAAGYVTPLASNADEYDYIAGEGHKNIGAWIDRAAQRAGR